jgi:Caspase domain
LTGLDLRADIDTRNANSWVHDLGGVDGFDQDESGGEGDDKEDLYLVAKNSTSKNKKYNAIAVSKLREAIAESPAERRILILDCCYSGRAITGLLATKDDAETADNQSIDIEGTYGVAAAPANQRALALPGSKYTAFTEQLVDVLEEGLPNDQSTLTLNDVFGEIRKRLRRIAKTPVPEVVNWQDGGLFKFAKN